MRAARGRGDAARPGAARGRGARARTERSEMAMCAREFYPCLGDGAPARPEPLLQI